MKRFLLLAVFALPLACNSTDVGTIAIITGGEADALTQSPAPTTFLVEMNNGNGTYTQVASVSASASTVGLADESEDLSEIFRVTGFDAQNVARVQGYSLPVDLAALANATLDVFVQRKGQLARMPSPLSDARPAPVVVTSVDRYIFVAGGSDPSLASSSQIYDLAAYAPVGSPPTLPTAPTAVAFSDTLALLFDDQGCTSFDLTDSTTAAVTPPSGGTFAEISGGATIALADGSSYVVGCTRLTEAPTPRILYIDPNGNLNFTSLSAPRLGCAATYISGTGLVVSGGSATVPGVEIVASNTATGVTLPYPPDASTGSGATVLTGTTILLAGGSNPDGTDAGMRTITSACSVCTPTPWTSAGFPVVLTTAQAFGLPDLQTAFVVGSESGGTTHAFTVNQATGLTVVDFKVPRSNARAVMLPTNNIAIVGGAPEIESFLP